MKLSEIKKKIEQGHFSKTVFADFQTALGRVPKGLRCQHCYTSAMHLKEKHPQDAIMLIRYGLEQYETDWVDQMRAHQNLGAIYEATGDYVLAKTAYETAVHAIPDDRKGGYLPVLSLDILRAELHANGFSYTDAVRSLYQAASDTDEFTASFRHVAFYMALAKLVIAVYDDDKSKQNEAYLCAQRALDGDESMGMDRLLLRHKYKNDARATKQALAFLKEHGI